MFFWQRLNAFGDRIALTDANHQVLTYRDLAEQADRLNLDPERPRLTLIPIANRFDAIIAYVAALRAHHPVILINEGDEVAIQRINDTFMPALMWQTGKGFIETGRASADIALHPDLCVLLSTSGTTGSTKLVRLSRDAVDANASSIGTYLGITPDDRAITTLPPSYSYGLSVINSHLAAGASLVLFEGSVIEPAFRAAIEAHQVTSIAGVPYTYDLLERSGLLNPLPVTIRTLTQAGGRMPPAQIERVATLAASANARLFVMYGQTEATARMAYLPPERLPELSDCIGRAIPGGQFTLADPDNGQQGSSSGELVYRGPNVMMGYAEAPADLAKGREIEVLSTGDLAEEVEPGIFRITGRKNRFIKMFGLRVSLDEVEKEALRMGSAVAATGVDDLLILAREGTGGDASIISEIARRYKLPEAQVHLQTYDRLPRLSSGKVDYRSIIADAQQDTAHPGTVSSDASSSDAVGKVFARCFPGKQIAPEDSFLSLGGDSLTYINFVLGMEAIVGTLPDAWEDLTVAQLTALADSSGKRGYFLSVEPAVFLRVVAPILVVANHGGLSFLRGGAALLMVLAGLNFAKFSFSDLCDKRPGKLLLGLMISVLVPYWLVILAYHMVRSSPLLPDLFLVNNFVDAPGKGPFETWFIQALFQSVLFLVLASLIPPIRKQLAEHGFRTSLLVLLGASVMGLLHRHFLLDILTNDGREWTYVFWLFALGLCASFVRTTSQRIATMAISVVMAANMYDGDYSRIIIVIAGTAMLVWEIRVSIPRFLLMPMTLIGSSSLFIYMIHGRAPASSFTSHWPVDVVRIVGGLIMGVVVYVGYEWGISRARQIIGALRQPKRI